MVAGSDRLGNEEQPWGKFGIRINASTSSTPSACSNEALTVGADPLHLALVFNLSHTAASRYATIAQNLLDEQTGVRRDAVGRESGRS
ncbi:hypothetical protein ACGFYQ_40610 [Streptomyces sp. NPDC048258]|uniref:hypothetical protein n=1 Tax=Streptomyces sp. NPDC048258 TaxID=3365527 RepID=UPI003717CE6D